MTKPERVMYYEGSKMSFLEYVDQLEKYVEELEEQLNIQRVVLSEAKEYEETLENLQQDEKGEYYFGKEKVSEMELCNHVGSVTRDGRGEYCKKCGKIW